jgi:hypothetical protein
MASRGQGHDCFFFRPLARFRPILVVLDAALLHWDPSRIGYTCGPWASAQPAHGRAYLSKESR